MFLFERIISYVVALFISFFVYSGGGHNPDTPATGIYYHGFLQIRYNLPIAPVIIIGVVGSILGRLILTLYIPKIADRVFNKAKSEDVRFLGSKLKNEFWKGQFFILFYTLMPLPSTPLFVAGGIAKMKPIFIIPVFVIGKVVSDTAAVLMGKYAAENTRNLVQGVLSWKSIAGLVLGLLLIFSIFFIDWRTLIQQKNFD